MKVGRSVATAIANHSAKKTDVHGVGSDYLVKTSQSDQSLSTAELPSHGKDQHDNVTREIFIPASTGWTNGAMGQVGNKPVAVLSDDVTQFVAVLMKVPDDFVSFVKVEAVWFCATGVGNMYWQFRADYGAKDEDYHYYTEDTTIGVTATGGALDQNVQESSDPLALTDLALGHYLGIELNREAGNALDTLNVDVDVLGFLFTYVANE